MLFVLSPRLAEVDVHVNQPRKLQCHSIRPLWPVPACHKKRALSRGASSPPVPFALPRLRILLLISHSSALEVRLLLLQACSQIQETRVMPNQRILAYKAASGKSVFLTR